MSLHVWSPSSGAISLSPAHLSLCPKPQWPRMGRGGGWHSSRAEAGGASASVGSLKGGWTVRPVRLLFLSGLRPAALGKGADSGQCPWLLHPGLRKLRRSGVRQELPGDLCEARLLCHEQWHGKFTEFSKTSPPAPGCTRLGLGAFLVVLFLNLIPHLPIKLCCVTPVGHLSAVGWLQHIPEEVKSPAEARVAPRCSCNARRCFEHRCAWVAVTQ